MIKNRKQFLKENEKEEEENLKNLSIKKAIKIMENLISSNLLKEFIYKPKNSPVSLDKLLKHGKLFR